MYFSVGKTRMKRKKYLFNANNELQNGFAEMVVDITLFLFPSCVNVLVKCLGKMSIV